MEFDGRNSALRRLVACAALFITPGFAEAGSYVVASEANGLDIITHPPGYTGSGTTLNIEVCIDANAADAADLEIPVRNVIKELNSLTASTPNLFFGANNNIPAGVVDFESLILHEMGHCLGLGHPNLGVQTGVSGANTNFTSTGDGVNDMFSFDAGTDTVIGSTDDQRDDDPNLHWFEIGVNNPFLGVTSPDSTNYSRDPADLPVSHDFAANAERDMGTLLGFSDTEAVMQQGQGSDEDQRSLQADDVATFEMAMTGLDELAGTSDDYFINLLYGGVREDTSGCDVVLKSQTSGFGACFIGIQPLSATHWRITGAEIDYNSDLTWFFNPVLNTTCAVGDATLGFSGVTHNDIRLHRACTSITYGPGYTVGASGNVTAVAPTIILQSGTSIGGIFTAVNTTP